MIKRPCAIPLAPRWTWSYMSRRVGDVWSDFSDECGKSGVVPGNHLIPPGRKQMGMTRTGASLSFLHLHLWMRLTDFSNDACMSTHPRWHPQLMSLRSSCRPSSPACTTTPQTCWISRHRGRRPRRRDAARRRNRPPSRSPRLPLPWPLQLHPQLPDPGQAAMSRVCQST